MKNETIIRLIKKNLSDDLRKPKYRGESNQLKGHCYVASEAFYHLCNNSSEWKPGTLRHEGDIHWLLKHRKTGEVVDITATQFTRLPDYDKFRGRGFLTKSPSKRTQKLIKKIRKDMRKFRLLALSPSNKGKG